MGTLVSGRLSGAGHEVALLARPEQSLHIRQYGLTVEDGMGGATHARPYVLSEIPEKPRKGATPDLVIVAVKAYDTTAAIPEIARLCGPDTCVLTLQNGIGNEEALADGLGGERILSGAFTLSASVPETGRVLQHTLSGGIGLAEMQVTGRRLATISEVFAHAGMRVRIYKDWRGMKWSKLLLNLLANASCAILQMTPREVFADSRLFRLEQLAFREARLTMRRMEIAPVDLPGYPVRLLCRVMALPGPLARRLLAPRVTGGRGDKMPSLAMDIARGKRRSEVTFLNGAVTTAAAGCGIPAPANALLASTLEAIAASGDGSSFHGHPEKLLAGLEKR